MPPGCDNDATPCGGEWLASYRTICAAHGIPVVGVSNVGPVTHGAWADHAGIGAALAMAADASIAARGPFGAAAETLIVAAVAVAD